MDFRTPCSPDEPIDPNDPIVRLDASIMHPRTLRMLGFTTNEGLDYADMAEALTTMFIESPDDDMVLAQQVTVAEMMQREKALEMHTQVSSSSSFTARDTVTTQARKTPIVTSRRQHLEGAKLDGANLLGAIR
ncbi:hypothetical protein K7X08_037247 [Anisodus acutangulus]|uniref:Uncharacterized protein n=1 Tax=Anisodus acutangulus TaxID=402998 RepID=A0A9Q1MZN1_9SOLA|nr:hypothetical protein K7X08_037247 [Anisodus acutangulus]